MDRNLGSLGMGSVVRAARQSSVLPFLVLCLRNVLEICDVEVGALAAWTGVSPLLIVTFGETLTDRLGRRWVFRRATFVEAGSLLGLAEANRARPVKRRA